MDEAIRDGRGGRADWGGGPDEGGRGGSPAETNAGIGGTGGRPAGRFMAARSGSADVLGYVLEPVGEFLLDPSGELGPTSTKETERRLGVLNASL